MKKTTDNRIEMSFQERLSLSNVIPMEGSIKTMIIFKELREKVAFTPEETIKFKIVQKGEFLEWSKEANSKKFYYSFSEYEKTEIKCILKTIDAKEKVTEVILSLCKKFDLY